MPFPPPPLPRKFIPAIGLLKWPGVGKGRNFTTLTVIGVENLTPYGRGGCWNHCISYSILVRHLTFGVGLFDGLPFPLVERLNTTFGPLDGKLEQLKVAGGGVGKGMLKFDFFRCIMKLLMKRNTCQSISTFRSTGIKMTPVIQAAETRALPTHSDTADNIFHWYLNLMHRTKQELFQDVHLLFLDDLECYLLSFWPNKRTRPMLFSMPILSRSARSDFDFRKTMSLQVVSC